MTTQTHVNITQLRTSPNSVWLVCSGLTLCHLTERPAKRKVKDSWEKCTNRMKSSCLCECECAQVDFFSINSYISTFLHFQIALICSHAKCVISCKASLSGHCVYVYGIAAYSSQDYSGGFPWLKMIFCSRTTVNLPIRDWTGSLLETGASCLKL